MQTLIYRLPLPNWPKAQVESNFARSCGRVLVEGQEILAFQSKDELEKGATAKLEAHEVSLGLDGAGFLLSVDGQPAKEESKLSAPTSRSAWIHAWIALLASFFGFLASYLYLAKAEAQNDLWSLKMSIHMAGWHLLLTLTLFPASVWGQRFGIRSVQGVSVVFFLIHLGIALANLEDAAHAAQGPGIALLNALSGLGFLASIIYGQRAHRDMDPLLALRER